MGAMIKAGIIGGAGYTAGELLRLLIHHPHVEVRWVQSSSNAGELLTYVHEGLIGDTSMRFAPGGDLSDVDVVFMCSGHGFSASYWQEHDLPGELRVIDLAQDFRDESCGYIYGLPEMNRERIASARLIANPGCYATAIQLSLLPLAAAGKLSGDVQVTGLTGSTGAGVKPTYSTHFSWRDNNLSVYKAFGHQHMLEVNRMISCNQPGYDGEVNFIPMRGDFPRGIYVTAWLRTRLSLDEARELYESYYRDAAFTHVIPAELGKSVDLKQAVNTNKCVISLEKHGDKLLICAAIDNLLKGASGQAVQNMNLMFGLPETTGLQLKPSAF